MRQSRRVIMARMRRPVQAVAFRRNIFDKQAFFSASARILALAKQREDDFLNH
jgi:hypothetical protein